MKLDPKKFLVIEEDFQVSKALNLENKRDYTILHQKSNKGIPVYNTFYKHYESFLLGKINLFNNDLKKNYPLNYTKASALLDITSPIFVHYNERFPEKQFIVLRENKKEFTLKPSACAHAFSTWGLKKKSLLKKEILHEVTDCYRIENKGTVRSLSRNCFFTMPDYHMITTIEDLEEDFLTLRKALVLFMKDLFSLQNFLELARLSEDVHHLNLEKLLDPLVHSTLHYENISKKVDPYYCLKWELSYRGSSKLYTLATLQIDYVYPKLFKVDETVYGPRVGLHFTMGSIPRLIQTILLEEKKVNKGLKLFVHNVDSTYPEVLEKLNLNYAYLIDDYSKSLSEALSFKNDLEETFFSLLICVLPKELASQSVLLVDRETKVQKVVPISSLKQELYKYGLIVSNENFYSSSFK